MLLASVVRATRSGIGALFVVLTAAPASAADCHPASGLSSCIDADNLWPHAGGGSFFAIGSATTTPAGAVSLGIVTSFLTHPIGTRVASADPNGSTVFLVDDALDATLLVAWGVAERLELTVALPWTIYQSGAGLQAVAAGADRQPSTAARDVRFGFTVGVLRREAESKGPALAVRVEFAAPTSSENAFAGGATAVAAPSVTFSYRLGRVDISAEAMARIRGEVAFANAIVGTQIGGALGASVDVIRDRWLGLGAEAFVLAGTSKQLFDPTDPTASVAPLVPAEWIAHASTAHFLHGDLTLAFGGGTTLPFTPHGALTSPRYRLDLAIRYAPFSHAPAARPAVAPP